MKLRFRLDKTARAGSRVSGRMCNLGCVWCHHDYFSHDGFVAISNDALVRALNRVIKAASATEAEIRIAGDGEPTLTGDELIDLVRRCTAIPQVTKVGLTTNGLRLRDMAAGLKDAGLNSVTVSLNALTHAGYARYAQRDCLTDALAGIERAHAAGLRVKLNLLFQAWNQGEIDAFEALSCRYGGMAIKVFDLIFTLPGDEALFVPLDRLEEALRPKAVSITEERLPYARRVYVLASGARFEVKIAGALNTCPVVDCPARSRCLEGCRHSIRIGLDGWMRPCGARADNIVDLFHAQTSDADIRAGLRSGGKIPAASAIADAPASASLSGAAAALEYAAALSA